MHQKKLSGTKLTIFAPISYLGDKYLLRAKNVQITVQYSTVQIMKGLQETY